jgi:O-antigen ligase
MLRTNLCGFAVFLISAIGILSGYHLVESFFSRDNLRLSFFAGDPNRTSLVTCVALCLSCVVFKAPGMPLIFKVWLSGTILFNSFALAFSHSRGSIIALMIFIVLYTRGTLARTLVIFLISLFAWIPSFRKYIIRNQSTGDFLGGTGRVGQIADAFQMYVREPNFPPDTQQPIVEVFAEGAHVAAIAQRPGLLETLFGHGLGSARDVLQPSTGLGSGHNAYLDLLIEIGIVGILLLMVALFATSRVLAPHIQAGDLRPALTGSLFFLISGMVTSSFGRPGPETFLAFIAFSVSLCAVRRPQNLDPSRQVGD